MAILQAEIITLRAIALKLNFNRIAIDGHVSRDHNATSYSTETNRLVWDNWQKFSRDHNATSYSTETLIKVHMWKRTPPQRS